MNDPAIFGMFYLGALMLRRGDVSPAKKTIGARVTDPNLWTYNAQLTKSAMEVHKVVIVPHDVSDEEAKKKYGLDEIRPADEFFPDEEKLRVLNDLADEGKHFLPKDSKSVIMSDTGEVWRDTARQVGAVDTPRTKIVYGMLNKETKALAGAPYEMKLNGLKVVCNTDFAVVGLSSLNDNPLNKSDNILLCTVGRASNTDTWFDGEKLVKPGHLPIQIEVIDAEIELDTDVENLRVWSVTDDGFYGARIPVEHLDGKIRFHVGPQWPSQYYLIMKE